MIVLSTCLLVDVSAIYSFVPRCECYPPFTGDDCSSCVDASAAAGSCIPCSTPCQQGSCIIGECRELNSGSKLVGPPSQLTDHMSEEHILHSSTASPYLNMLHRYFQYHPDFSNDVAVLTQMKRIQMSM